MSKLIVALALTLIFLLSGCLRQMGTNEMEQFKSLPALSAVSFATLKQNVLTPHCVRCHDWAESEGEVNRRVVPGNPGASVLYQRVADGSMPTDGGLSDDKISYVKIYIEGIKRVIIHSTPGKPKYDCPPVKDAPKGVPIEGTYKSLCANLLQVSCLDCHGTVKIKDAAEKFLSYEELKKCAIDEEVEDEEDSEVEDSPCYMEMEFESMPPEEDDYDPVTEEVLKAFKDWADAGFPKE
ncbi:MAG: hypothetical protein HOE90_11985 [Bacteriovoracaceae bacterium]|jgi:hypothetical protein|nr:hypothetical protein [Bacteriovoracaceae bacterium]